MINKSIEEVRELLKEEISSRNNLNKEITINEGMQFKVEIALACSLEESMYNAQLVIYNGKAQELDKDKSLMSVDYVIDSIEFDLGRIGLSLLDISLTIYKFDFFEGVNKVNPIFDNPMMNPEETNRLLVDPRTLSESRKQIMLFVIEKLLDENKEKYQLTEDFIEKFNNDFDGYSYHSLDDYSYQYFLNLTDKEIEFMEYCYDIATDAYVEKYKYNDPICGELTFYESRYFYEYSMIDVDSNNRFRSIGIPFKVFGEYPAIKLGTIKTK